MMLPLFNFCLMYMHNRFCQALKYCPTFTNLDVVINENNPTRYANLDDFVVSARNRNASTLDYIVMQRK